MTEVAKDFSSDAETFPHLGYLFPLSPTGVAHLGIDVAHLDVLVAHLGKLGVAHLLPRNHPHCKPRLTPHQPMGAQTKDTSLPLCSPTTIRSSHIKSPDASVFNLYLLLANFVSA